MSTEPKTAASIAVSPENLRELLDYHELTKLLNSYVYCADDRRWDEWAALFSSNGVVEMPQGAHRGREGLGDWAAASLAGFPSMMHFSGNHDLRVNGDTATSRSKVIAVCVPDTSNRGKHLIWGGVYSTTFVREASGWRIAKLRFDLVWSQGAKVVEGPK
jgi:hypothetical protein